MGLPGRSKEIGSPPWLSTEPRHGSCHGSPAHWVRPHSHLQQNLGRDELSVLGCRRISHPKPQDENWFLLLPGPHFCYPPILLLPSFQFLTSCLYHSSSQTSWDRGQVLLSHAQHPPPQLRYRTHPIEHPFTPSQSQLPRPPPLANQRGNPAPQLFLASSFS